MPQVASPQAWTVSFMSELLTGIHVFGTDVLKLALFNSSASLSYATTAYSTANEITGTGYTAGGKTLALASGYPQISGRTVLIDFDDVTWDPGVFDMRYGLIYNSSKANRSIAVLDPGATLPALSSFVIEWPPGTVDHAIMRLRV